MRLRMRRGTFDQLVIVVAGLVLWFALYDLPQTSNGGFWYYLWPVYVILFGSIIAIEVVQRRMKG